MQYLRAMNTYDVLIVGGGIVGLSTAYRISMQYPHWKLAILEKESGLATHQTSHNSGVIHSGIYYRPGSFKAKLCQEGYQQLIDFCEREGIDYERCGKVIVATHPDQIPRLQSIQQRGIQNGMKDVLWWGVEQTREREPHVAALASLFVPQAGIIRFADVATKFAEKVRAAGGEIHQNTQVLGITHAPRQVTIETSTRTFTTKLVITCGGLWADRLARMTENRLDLRILPFRGEYYALKEEARHLVNHLIYPVPNPALPFLGVHFTRRITGIIDVGPSAVLAWAREGYQRTDFSWRDMKDWMGFAGSWKLFKGYWKIGLDEYYRSFSKKAFIKAAQHLIPELRADQVEAAPSGVRAQAIRDNGELEEDFRLFKSPGIVHVVNAPSPAATSSLAIGAWIASEAVTAKLD